MNSEEKCELLKNTIYQLYINEGRSKSYISRLLDVNRKTLGEKINNEWNFPEPKKVRYMRPSTRKFINANKELILSRLKNNISIKEISRELKVDRNVIMNVVSYDKDVEKEYNSYINRLKENHIERIEGLKERSSHEYIDEITPGEKWKPILGYDRYQVSDKGRFRSYAERYKSWHLLTPSPNVRNGRLYISIVDNEGKRRNLMAARVVAHAFVDGFSEERNTVNHKDGNVSNNDASNLEWMSQAENNIHAHKYLSRKKQSPARQFERIVYKGKYEFKTCRAFARFIGISDTQALRYTCEPEKHDLEIFLKTNCND